MIVNKSDMILGLSKKIMGGRTGMLVRTGFLAACILSWMISGRCACAADMDSIGIKVHNVRIPVIIGRDYNVVAELCIDNFTGREVPLEEVGVRLSGMPPGARTVVRLVYTGTMSALYSRTTSYAMKDAFWRMGAGQRIYCDPGYVMPQSPVIVKGDRDVRLPSEITMQKGTNWLYVSISFADGAIGDIATCFSLDVSDLDIGGQKVFLEDAWKTGSVIHRMAVGVRDHGDDGVWSYRIPGIVTASDGSLVAVYDVRHSSTLDLQDNIDVGMSRSLDGGRTWEKMRIIMDMGRWGGLPDAQNGIGDPSILVDEQTGEIFVVAVWTHGLGNDRAWNQVGSGFSPEETAQLMIVSSKDNGRTWSSPRNITAQVKQRDWRFTLQGPGRGISMADGTLVFPMQYVGPDGIPSAGVMYSTDHGLSWNCHGGAWSNTTESQVVEISPGVLMLNMRNNNKTGRIVCTTEDLGRTWTAHPSSGKLREPVCMAGLINIPASENILGRDILLFSNPDTVKGRHFITIKASLDGGLTWLPENSVLLDEEEGWGYSCMTMIDSSTVGILYEGSTSQLVFQAVRLADIIRQKGTGK